MIGPNVVALGMIFFLKGRQGISNLFKKFHLQFEKSLFTMSFLFFPTIFLVVFILTNIFIPVYTPRSIYPDDFWEMMLLFFVLAIGGEIGWRGYLFDRLQQHYTPIWSSVIVGVVWGLYYFPIFLSPGFFIYWWNFSILWGIFILASIVISYFYNQSNQSLVVSLLLNIAYHLMLILFYFNYIIGGRLTLAVMVPFLLVPLDLGLLITLIIMIILTIIILLRFKKINTKITTTS
jgi:membrane protease YdiL (CAAX protease family)